MLYLFYCYSIIRASHSEWERLPVPAAVTSGTKSVRSPRRSVSRTRSKMKNTLRKSFHNIFNLLGICRRALGRAGKIELWDEFFKEATSGDYNHALTTIIDWFVVCSVDESEDKEE